MKLHNYCLKLASLGPVGNMFGGTIIATGYAFACIIFGKFVYWTMPALAYGLFIVILLVYKWVSHFCSVELDNSEDHFSIYCFA